MIRPKDLLVTIKIYSVRGVPTGVVAGKRNNRGMPILRCDYHLERLGLHEFFGRQQNVIGLSHRQGTARHEIQLNIDHE